MKLVRDGIPHKFPNNEYHVVEGRELAVHLRLKLMEEAGEVVGARNVREVAQELADVLEVVRAIADHYSISHRELVFARADKAARLGGFAGGWVMTDFDEGN